MDAPTATPPEATPAAASAVPAAPAVAADRQPLPYRHRLQRPVLRRWQLPILTSRAGPTRSAHSLRSRLACSRSAGTVLACARPTEAAARPALTDLNKADQAELEQVPGIGPSLAREIAADRQKRGQFKSVEELRRVKGVGPATFDKVRTFLQVDPANLPSQKDPAEQQPLVLERRPARLLLPQIPGWAETRKSSSLGTRRST